MSCFSYVRTIFCHEWWQRGSYQVTLGRICSYCHDDDNNNKRICYSNMWYMDGSWGARWCNRESCHSLVISWLKAVKKERCQMARTTQKCAIIVSLTSWYGSTLWPVCTIHTWRRLLQILWLVLHQTLFSLTVVSGISPGIQLLIVDLLEGHC